MFQAGRDDCARPAEWKPRTLQYMALLLIQVGEDCIRFVLTNSFPNAGNIENIIKSMSNPATRKYATKRLTIPPKDLPFDHEYSIITPHRDNDIHCLTESSEDC
jgi:hypothetical protein